MRQDKKIKHKKRSITKKTLIYTGGSILASLSMAGSTYLYSKYTTTQDYGNFQLTVSIMMLLATVGFLDIRTSTLRFMYGIAAENEDNRNKAIYSGGLIFTFCIFLLFLTVYIANRITNVPFPKIGFIWALSYALGNFYLFVTRGLDKEYSYSIAYSLFYGALLFLNLYFLAFRHYGAKYILIAMTIAEFIQVIYLEMRIGILKNFKPRFLDKKIIKHMIKFSIPLAVTALGTWIMSYYASIQVTAILGSSANGIFSMAMEFAKSVPMATAGIILAWQEIAFSRKTESINKIDTEYFSSSITSIFRLFSCFFIVFIPLMQLVIPFYLSDAFQSVSLILALCTAGFTFDCISQMVASIFGNNIDSKPIMISTIVGSLFLIITLPFFIRYNSTFGAPLCVCIAFGLTLLVRVLWLDIVLKFKISHFKILLTLTLAVAVGYYSTTSSIKMNILILAIGLLIGIPTLRHERKKIN